MCDTRRQHTRRHHIRLKERQRCKRVKVRCVLVVCSLPGDRLGVKNVGPPVDIDILRNDTSEICSESDVATHNKIWAARC